MVMLNKARGPWRAGCRWPALLAAGLTGAVMVHTVAGSPPPDRPLQPTPSADACDRLTALPLPAGAITLAGIVGAGSRVEADLAPAPRSLCRVAATLTPSADSAIRIEVWMPVSGWNRKFQAVGNGAFSGAIAYPALTRALDHGYAAASTDTGHAGNTASFAPGHPEKVIDFGWRAVHEMTLAAKAIVNAYYGAAPRYSYWNGCSAGGRQAMMEAQRFPADFDGIVAGAPGLDWTGRAAQALRVAKRLEADRSARLREADRRLLHAAALNACDALDGAKDGLIGSPERCRFDPGVLQCTGPNPVNCLTTAQIDTARFIYASPINRQSGRPIPGLLPGSELGWTDLGWTASARATGLEHFRHLVFDTPRWPVSEFDFDADVVRAEAADRGTINALDPDLTRFIAGGGRMIHYHGWSDPQISPGISTQYYDRVVDTVGGAGNVQGAYRLFMAPGMGHCSGGEGPDTFDMMAALEQWVEEGRAPDRILATQATRGTVVRSRPLCPYPQVATYRGAGSLDTASSFDCRQP